MSRLIWGETYTDNASAIRDYFVNLALKRHSATAAMAVQDIIDEMLPDIINQADQFGIAIGGLKGASASQDAIKFLDGFEDKFYEKIDSVIRQIEEGQV